MNYQISLIYSNLVVRAGKDKIQIQVVNLPQDCKLEYQISEGFEVNVPTKSVFQISSQTSLKGTFKVTMKNNQGEVLAESEELNIETIKVDSIEFTTKDVEITYGTPVDFDLVVTPEGALDEKGVMLDLPDGIEFVEGKLEATYPGAVGTVKAKVFDLVAEKKVSTKGLKVTAKSAFVIGKSTNLVVIASPNKPVTFESTDTQVATVSSTGVVTCLKEGSCEIIVKCDEFTSNISVEPVVGFTPVEKLNSEIVSSMHIFGSIEKLFQYAAGRQVVTSLLDDNFSTLYYIKTNSDPNIFEYELAMINKDFDKYQYLTLDSGEGPVDPSQGVTQEQLNKAIQDSEKKTQENIDGINKDINENIKPELTKSVKYQEFEYNGQKRKSIQLANYDSISGVDTKGEGHNLVMVSKWDKADFGAPKLPFNINGSEPRPTYNDEKSLALLDDIKGIYNIGKIGSYNDVKDTLANVDIISKAENALLFFIVSNETYGEECGYCENIYTQGKVYQTLHWKDTIQKRTLTINEGTVQEITNFEISNDSNYVGNKYVKGDLLFKLTLESSNEDIIAALTYNLDGVGETVVTDADLNKAFSEGKYLRDARLSTPIQVGWDGTSFLLTQVSMTSPKSNVKVSTVNIKYEGDQWSCTKVGSSSDIALKSDIDNLTTSVFGIIDFKKYISDPKYTAQVINKLEESYISDLGTPQNIDGKPYDADSNNYVLDKSYLVFAKINEEMSFEYDMFRLDGTVDLGFIGKVMTSVSTLQDTYDSRLKKIEDRLTALESK